MLDYELLKRIFWPHIVIPFLVLVVLSYADVLTGLLRGLAIFWISVQVLGFAVGFWTGAYASFGTKETLWANIHKYNVVKIIPTIKIGMILMEWALTEEGAESKPVKAEPEAVAYEYPEEEDSDEEDL